MADGTSSPAAASLAIAGRASASSALTGSCVGEGSAWLNAQDWCTRAEPRAAGTAPWRRRRPSAACGLLDHVGLHRGAGLWPAPQPPAASSAPRSRAAPPGRAPGSRRPGPAPLLARGVAAEAEVEGDDGGAATVSSSTRQACTTRGTRSRPDASPSRSNPPRRSGSPPAAAATPGAASSARAQPGQRVAVEADDDGLLRRGRVPRSRNSQPRPTSSSSAKPSWLNEAATPSPPTKPASTSTRKPGAPSRSLSRNSSSRPGGDRTRR